MKQRFLQFASTTILIAILGLAWAGPGNDDAEGQRLHRDHHGMMHGGPHFDHMVDRMSRHLELDDTQEQKIRNIVEAARPEAEALREQAKANREAMHALETTDPAYDVKLQNLAVTNGELATRLTLLHGRVMAEVNAELNDEQKAKMAAGRDRMHKRFRHHRQLLEPSDDTTT